MLYPHFTRVFMSCSFQISHGNPPIKCSLPICNCLFEICQTLLKSMCSCVCLNRSVI